VCQWSIALLCAALPVAHAQIVQVKTSPLAEGDQFTFLPSLTRAMGGVTIALRDTLLDPFVNPATGMRTRRTWLFGSPSFYSLSRNGSAGTTLPMGVMRQAGNYFGALVVATQVVEPTNDNTGCCSVPVALAASSISSSFALFPGPPQRHSRTNNYVFAGGGRTIRDSTASVAASLRWSRLGGVDGADLLYPGANDVGQRVDEVDLRLGVARDWATRSAEVAIVHQRWSARHDVSYLSFMWDPGTRTVLPDPHTDVNFDRRHLWGVHLDVDQQFVDSTWRVGAVLTANRTTQPVTPLLGPMVPSGDPGRSSAFNVGVGVGHTRNKTVAGIDAIYEPIWAQRTLPDQGSEDRYRFANATVRGGAAHDFAVLNTANTVRMQGGMQWHRIAYSLDEFAGSASQHRSRASWSEWTHTVGAAYRSPRFEFRYEWRMQSGMNRPGIEFPEPVFRPDDSFVGPQFPQMSMLPVHVTTQQFSFSLRMP